MKPHVTTARAGHAVMLLSPCCFRVALVLIVLMAGLGACSSSKKPPSDRPVPVAVATAVQKAVPVTITAVGSVEASQTVSVRSRIDGLIARIFFTEGQDVRQGELLLELDSRAQAAALRQAEAALQKDAAQAQNARVTQQRYALLLEKNYVSREEYDVVRTNQAMLEAAVQADQAAVDNARVELQYCRIYAPITGRTGLRKVDQGNLIRASETEIVTINQTQPVNVVFSIPDREVPRVKAALSKKPLMVEAVLPGDIRPEQGTLTFIDNAIDKTTGTITLKGVFPNREKRLLPGQFVDVRLLLSTLPAAVLVPTRSIEQGQAGPFVYVVRSDATVEMRPVTTGPSAGDATVISQGLRLGERVVTDGQLRLKPGARVSIKDQP